MAQKAAAARPRGCSTTPGPTAATPRSRRASRRPAAYADGVVSRRAVRAGNPRAGHFHPRAARSRSPRSAVAPVRRPPAGPVTASGTVSGSSPSSTASRRRGAVVLPGGALIVPERPGRLHLPNGVAGPPLTGLPAIWVKQDGGLIDAGVHPDYAENGWIYLAFSEPGGSAQGASTTRVVRGKSRRRLRRAADALPGLAGSVLARQHALRLAASSGTRASTSSSRLATAATSTRAGPEEPVRQDPSHQRRRTAPKDNPFVNTPGAVKTIWSYGHRNPQGWRGSAHRRPVGERARSARRRRAEHRRAGQNYGWPVTTYGMNYDGTPSPTAPRRRAWCSRSCTGRRRLPSAASRSTAATFPQWKGDLFAAALAASGSPPRDRRRQLTHQERCSPLGRIRQVVNAPDGTLLVVFVRPTDRPAGPAS